MGYEDDIIREFRVITMLNPVYKQQIILFLEDFFAKKQDTFANINEWGSDVSEKLFRFIVQGKMIRGSLVLFFHEVYQGEVTEDAIKVATAIELLHSSLLIHDDIMDNDSMRRGQQTIFAQYQSLAERENFLQARHFGESMGMSVGDIGFFLAMQLVGSIQHASRHNIIDLCMQELMQVGLAQMQDVYFGYRTDQVTEKEIEKVYLYKTGRYTFSLPMMLGAFLANQDKKNIHQLEALGEALGLLFQLKDDELSLFGSQAVTGKPEGSDIRENKKTFYRFYLFEKASSEEKQTLEMIFGNEHLTLEQFQYVKKCIADLHIQEMLDKKIQHLQQLAEESILSLEVSHENKKQLLQILTDITQRKK